MLSLTEIISRPEYKWLEQYKDRLCFICLGGSHAYGTNIESSDIDIRGVMLPTKEEIIGLKHFDQRIDEETDTCIYEFNKFVKLVYDCNPNVIELLGCREYLIFNDVGHLLIDNARLFLSKKCSITFGGYATAQLRRLENALCHDEFTEEQQNKHIKDTMNDVIEKHKERYNLEENSINIIQKENHLYINANIKELRIDTFREAFNSILDIERTYNKLNKRNDKKTPEKLNKHIMHLIRLHLMCLDILEKHEINTYREKDRDFLLQVRNGKFLKDGKLTEDFYPYLKELEERLNKAKEQTSLPNKPDFDKVQKLIMKVNTQVINDTIVKYNKPLEEVIV